MKKSFLSLFIFCAFLIHAQEKTKQVLSVSIPVKGNCESCEKRIENAADIKGVKSAEWDAAAQMLAVVYRGDKTTREKIVEAILNCGHDADGKMAPESVYNKLPACCKFRTQKCDK
jgi:periplasmic mercuric ion binding protein